MDGKTERCKDRKTERQKDIKTEKDRDIQEDRKQMDRKTEKQMDRNTSTLQVYHHFRTDVSPHPDDRVCVDVGRGPDGAEGGAVVGGRRDPDDAEFVDDLKTTT